MGLDMYLKSVPRVEGFKPEDVISISLSMLKNPKVYNKCSEDGTPQEVPVPEELLPYVRDNLGYGYFGIDERQEAYWRKANQIHAWFVDNVQNGEDDCEAYIVSREDIEALCDTCKEVLNSSKLVDGKVQNGGVMTKEGYTPTMEDGKVIKDSSVAESLLPMREGFFFGGSGYDEYYFNDVEETVKMLEDILKNFDFGNRILFYHASW